MSCGCSPNASVCNWRCQLYSIRLSIGRTRMTASLFNVLAQQSDPRVAWLPVVLLIIIAIGFAVGNVVLSIWIGPKRTGPGKGTTYESGMVPTGDARQRFNVRFYLVAMIFL